MVKLLGLVIGITWAGLAQAELSLPSIFSDNMVLQQKQANTVWGKAEKGSKISVKIAGQTHKTTVDADGHWRVELHAVDAGGPYTLEIRGDGQRKYQNVLFGEVWHCSGQSNMGFPVQKTNYAELEVASANYADIRLLSVPRVGASEPQFNFDSHWQTNSPETVKGFSAVCYFFGRRLHTILNVPIGLIDTSWGGSPAESFVARPVLEKQPSYKNMLHDWDKRAADFTEEKFAQQKADYEQWLAAGSPGKKRFPPSSVLTGNKRPSNIFNGLINPIVGYGIKGAIWYQGESNIGKASQYDTLFSTLITSWRHAWGQGDFPFYWVQLADHTPEVSTPSESSPWATLREAQTKTLSLPNTGQAVITDLGEANDIHPRNKQYVADRLVLHPLAKVYGYEMTADSPVFKKMELAGDSVILSFDDVSSKLYAFDTDEIRGFVIAGKDKKFVNAKAEFIAENKIKVWSQEVQNPVAVRYAWENNPVSNIYDKESNLPLTPFRTDDW